MSDYCLIVALAFFSVMASEMTLMLVLLFLLLYDLEGGQILFTLPKIQR